MADDSNTKVSAHKLILENRVALFDRECYNKEKRQETWTTIFDQLISDGTRLSGKSFEYVRDTWWPNNKKASKLHYQNPEKSKPHHVEIDQLIKEIMGDQYFANSANTIQFNCQGEANNYSNFNYKMIHICFYNICKLYKEQFTYLLCFLSQTMFN